MPTRVKPGGWGFAEKLTSPQVTQLDANAGNALDRLDAGVERIRRVASLSALKAIAPGTLTANDACYVHQVGLYLFDPSASGSESSPALITPSTNPALGRWRWDSVRAGTARIPATSLQRGLVYVRQERRSSPVTFDSSAAIATLATPIPPSAIHCQPGDIMRTTLSFRIAMYSSVADASSDTSPETAWPLHPDSLTFRASGATLVGSDPLASSNSWVGASGRHTLEHTYVDAGAELWALTWQAIFTDTPATLGLHDIRALTTVIRP